MTAFALHHASTGRLSDERALELASCEDLPAMMAIAASLRDAGFGDNVSYSRKVFISLTHLCRDVCHYCTFARPPRSGEKAFMSIGDVLATAGEGVDAGCTEALLGDKPELRYRVAQDALAELGRFCCKSRWRLC